MATSATPSDDLDEIEIEIDPDDAYDAWCAQAFVSIDNATSPDFTLVKLEILDYKVPISTPHQTPRRPYVPRLTHENHSQPQ